VPATDQGSFTIGMQLPPGTALAQTDQATEALETRLLAYPEIKTVLSSIGGRGTPEQPISTFNSRRGCAPRISRPRHALNWPTSGLDHQPGHIHIDGSGRRLIQRARSPGTDHAADGGQPDELNAYALKLAEQLKQVPGLVDIDVSYKPGKPEAEIVVDRRKAADLGINAATVGGTVRMLVEGDKVATFKGEGAEADIRVQLREEDRRRLDQVLDLQVPTGRGFVPLRQIANLELSTGPTQIGA